MHASRAVSRTETAYDSSAHALHGTEKANAAEGQALSSTKMAYSRHAYAHPTLCPVVTRRMELLGKETAR
eukprot:3685077-Rhodomonas_salina.2